jgi:hypothetical protein
LGNPVATSDITENVQVTLFPNPVETDLLVTLSDYVPLHGGIVIYDLMGRQKLRKRIYYGLNNVDVAHLTSGTYLYKVLDGIKMISSGKLVKI